MDIKAGLYAYLLSKTSITLLVANRIFPEQARQGTPLPYITYEVTDTEPTVNLQGASAFADYAITFTVHAADSESRHNIIEALRNILHTRRNVTLIGSVDLRSATLQGISETYSSPINASEGGVFEAEMDFRVIFFETVPTLP